MVSSFLAGNRKIVSSSKWWIIDFEKAPCKSLMYTRNNKVSDVEPCGVPQVTRFVMEQWPSKENYCVLFFREELNQLLANPCIP